MERPRNTEELEHFSAEEQLHDREHYTPRPKFHVIMAWVLAFIVIFAFLGTCYWLAFGKF